MPSRRIERAGAFRRDLKRELKGRFGQELPELLAFVLTRLAGDQPLPARYSDHLLTGDWAGCRDCHVRPDLVLIYRLMGEETLQLIRLGSHSELDL